MKYQTYFDAFKIAMGQWINWHTRLCDVNKAMTDGQKYGSDYEAIEMQLPRVE